MGQRPRALEIMVTPRRLLLVGNQGYVGSVLARHLRALWPEAELTGFDSGLFAHCLTAAPDSPEHWLDRQLSGDLRDIDASLLAGIDGVIALAAISNDPMGDRFADVTDAINHRATIRLARLAAAAGVGSFVFASSCSVYGAAGTAARREDDPLAPLSAYARSKIATEQALAAADLGEMRITCLRFATACGMSDRLRLDLVLNDFVAAALATGTITVLSDGTPWRPLIDVADMARALAWAVARPAEAGGRFLVANAGADDWNLQVRDLAEAVAREIPGTKVAINQKATPDPRSYRVDFSRFSELAPAHRPSMTLPGSIGRLRAGLSAMGFADPDFRRSPMMRLRVLEDHIAAGRLSADLRWQPAGAATS